MIFFIFLELILTDILILVGFGIFFEVHLRLLLLTAIIPGSPSGQNN